MEKTAKFHTALYLSISFGFAYAVWIAEYLCYKVFHVIGLMEFLSSTTIPMLGPALGSLAVSLLRRRGKGRAADGPRRVRWAGAASAVKYSALGVAAVAVVLLFSAVAGAVLFMHWFGRPVDWGPFPAFLAAWAVCLPVWIPLVFLEEIGWRYYLFNAWKTKGFLVSGLLLGLIWAVWHLPTFFFYGALWFNLVCYLLFVPALHFLEAWAYSRGKSLLVPILVHAAYNAFATATGVSRFLYSGRMPYEMNLPDMVIKMGSNLLFSLALLPFAFLLARDLRKLRVPKVPAA